MVGKLSSESTLQNLKKEAKRWLKQVRGRVPGARERLLEAHPQSPAEPTLRDVQHALARLHGYASWRELRSGLDDRALRDQDRDARAALLLDLACLSYGAPQGQDQWTGHRDTPLRRQRAARLLSQHPDLSRHAIHTAVVCGDLDAVQGFLRRDPAAAKAKGGPQRWEPLLFLAYGRLPIDAAHERALDIATLLLDHGADPNAYWSYRSDGALMKWPVLCGVIADGEAGPVALPPHPHAMQLARLLLERGADPNPSQALYNTMLRGDDTRWLELLIAFGLDARAPVAWSEPAPDERMFQYLLGHAVDRGQLQRARLLLEHGADPSGATAKPYHERALMSGNAELAELLLEHGAPRSELSGVAAFAAACMLLDEPRARELLSEHPEYRQAAGDLLIHGASSRDLVEVARLLLDLGVSPDYEHKHGRSRALHGAACSDAVGVIELLLERGADVDACDGRYNSRPIGWALHNHAPRALEILERRTRCVFSLVAGGLLEPLRALLAREPGLARATLDGERALGLGQLAAEPGQTALFVLPEDEDRALELLDVLLAAGVDPARRDRTGKTAAERALERGLDQVADALLLLVEQSGQRIAWFQAAEEGDVATAERLLSQQPALVHERRSRHEAHVAGLWGVTALHLAAQHGRRALAELLIDAGAELEARALGDDERGGGTVLHWAAHYDQLALVELCVQRGANVNPDAAASPTGDVGEAFDLFEHDAIRRYLVALGALEQAAREPAH